jgi:hypothetical protein
VAPHCDRFKQLTISSIETSVDVDPLCVRKETDGIGEMKVCNTYESQIKNIMHIVKVVSVLLTVTFFSYLLEFNSYVPALRLFARTLSA